MYNILMTSATKYFPLFITTKPGTPFQGVVTIRVKGNEMYEYAIAEDEKLPLTDVSDWTYALGSEEITVKDPNYDGTLRLTIVYKSSYGDIDATIELAGDLRPGDAPRLNPADMGITRAPGDTAPATQADTTKPVVVVAKPAAGSSTTTGTTCTLSQNLPQILIAGGLLALGVHYATSEKGRATFKRAGRSLKAGITRARQRLSRLSRRSRVNLPASTRTNLPMIRAGALTN